MVGEQKLVMTVKETASALGLGINTAYELVRTGEIPSCRLGRRIVVPLEALKRTLNQHEGDDQDVG